MIIDDTLDNTSNEELDAFSQMMNNADIVSATTVQEPTEEADSFSQMMDNAEAVNDITLQEPTEESDSFSQMMSNADVVSANETARLETAIEEVKKEDDSLWNVINEGGKYVLHEIGNTKKNAELLSKSLIERGKGIFGSSNPDNLNLLEEDEYTYNVGDNLRDQIAFNVSKGFWEFAYITAGTVGGLGAGALAGGVGAPLGGAIGRTLTTGTVAADVYANTLKEGYKRYLSEGKDKQTAFEKAVTDALVESGVEFGSDWLLGKAGGLAKIGTGRLSKYITKLVTNGDIKISKAGMEVTAAGKNSILNLFKSILGGAAIEGGEEGVQQSWEAGRHRKEGQTVGEALAENAGNIVKSTAIGTLSGGLSIGVIKGVSKSAEVATNKLLEHSETTQEDINNAIEYAQEDEEKLKLNNTTSQTLDVHTRKKLQNEIIQNSNPVDETLGDHTWIRSEEDIKSFDELDGSEGITPDFTKEDFDTAKSTGVITVYSSKPIENGVFVSPSQMIAKDYAGSDKVYSKTLSVNDIAWIDESEGQVAIIKSDNNFKETTPKLNEVTPIGNNYGEHVQGNQEVDAQGDTVLTSSKGSNDTVDINSKLSYVIDQLSNYTEDGELIDNEILNTLSDKYTYNKEDYNKHKSSHKTDSIQHNVNISKHFDNSLLEDMVDVINSYYPELSTIVTEETSDKSTKLFHAYDNEITGSNNKSSTLIGNGIFFAPTQALTSNFGKNVISINVPNKDILTKNDIEKVNKKLIELHNKESNPKLKLLLSEFISGEVDEKGNYTDSNINYNNMESTTTDKDTKYEVNSKILMLSRLTGKSVIAYKHYNDTTPLEYVVYNKTANHPQVYRSKSVKQKQQIQDDVNETTINQGEKLKTTRKEISDALDLENTEVENSIPGSVSDNGYTSPEAQPVELTGLASKDEVPSTPQTDKALIDTYQNETKFAFKKLGIKESPSKDTVVKNSKISSIHKYYGVKNFVEFVGSAIVDKAGHAYDLFVKAELTGKEKRLKKIPKGVQGYTSPAKNNVIRVANSRDYHTILHETAHHLVHKTKVFYNAINNNSDILREEHKRLEKLNPAYRLNEKAYEERGDNITEEYLVDLFGAYATDEFTPSSEVINIINEGLNNLGPEVKAKFDIARQQFVDYNNLKSQKDGALKITQNNMEAARKLQRGLFDTQNLSAEQLTAYRKIINYAKSTPRWLVTTFFNENFQIEQDAKRTGNFKTVLKADQALLSSNRIAHAFINGTGLTIENNVLRKLGKGKEIKNLTRIFREAEALGEGYENKLEALLYAKQTIGESTGNQRKADVLIQTAVDLGYDNWLDARRDLKLLSLAFKSNLYQGKEITDTQIKEAMLLKENINRNFISEENTEGKSIQTDLNSIDFKDPKLISRLNNLINYIQNKAVNVTKLEIAARNSAKEAGVLQGKKLSFNRPDLKNDFIRDNFILDKQGSVNTGMTLEDALSIYTAIQSDPKIQQLEVLEEDVRTLLYGLNHLMMKSSTSNAMQLSYIQEGTGAWYIPLLRFIDVNEEKAIGINLKGSSFKSRKGSNREVLDIYTSIENLIQGVAKHVTTQQAMDYLLSLKNEPIFAQYIREIPANSKEVVGDLLQIVTSKITDLRSKLKEYDVRGEKLPERPMLVSWINTLEQIKEDIETGKVSSEDVRLKLFVEDNPTNKNVIQRMEKDGRVHYYLIDDTIKNFLNNQRKNIFNILNQNQFFKDHLSWIEKVTRIVQSFTRASFTVINPSFQAANIARDSMDVAFKGENKNTFVNGMLVPIRFMSNVANTTKLIGGLLSATNREEYKRIMDLYGGGEQTQWKEGEYTTTYLNYKLNKKGKLVRGGTLGLLESIMESLGNTDLLPRITALKNRCKQLGIDLYEATASYGDYTALNLPKRVLKKYFTDSEIESVLGKDKAQAWKETGDKEFFPYVPEVYEQEDLNRILIDKGLNKTISNITNADIRSELQDIYDRSSIDFSKGTLSSRTFGKLWLFANTILQGGYQTVSFALNNKKYATGAFGSLMLVGVMQTLLGWEDDEPSDEEARLRGFEIKPLGINIPMQSIMLMPIRMGNALGKILVNHPDKKLREDLTSMLFDNTLGAFSTPSGVFGILASIPTFLISGEMPNFGEAKKYNEFNYFTKLKVGANVDHLVKSMDSVLSVKLSKFLVDNGVYKYSAHEINRALQAVFGNLVDQAEGLLGISTIFNRRENQIDWLNYEWDPVGSFAKSITKPFKIKEAPRSPDSEALFEIKNYSMSMYDRYTNQIGTSGKNRIKPNNLSKEDRENYQKYYDKSYLAGRAIKNLAIISRVYYQIDDTKVGADKAKRDIINLYKNVARTYRKWLDNYEGEFNGDDRSYQKYYKSIDNEVNSNLDSLSYITDENFNASKKQTLTKSLLTLNNNTEETK